MRLSTRTIVPLTLLMAGLSGPATAATIRPVPALRPAMVSVRGRAPLVVHHAATLTLGGLRTGTVFVRHGATPVFVAPRFAPAGLFTRLTSLFADPVRPCGPPSAPATIALIPAAPAFAAQCLHAVPDTAAGPGSSPLAPAHNKNALYGGSFAPVDLRP